MQIMATVLIIGVVRAGVVNEQEQQRSDNQCETWELILQLEEKYAKESYTSKMHIYNNRLPY